MLLIEVLAKIASENVDRTPTSSKLANVVKFPTPKYLENVVKIESKTKSKENVGDEVSLEFEYDDRRNADHETSAPQQLTTTAREEAGKVLALIYPPGLMGGYRNQVIRFLSLIVTALHRNITSLLLPSLLWSTQIDINGTETWVPIPHDLMFDIVHWNSFSGVLPTLVEATDKMDCWTTHLPTNSDMSPLVKEVVQRGFLTPIANTSYNLVTRNLVTNLRKLDVMRNVSHCKHPSAYGGGKGSGRLWRDYTKTEEMNNGNFDGADANLLKALRPRQEWRDLAQSCVTGNVHFEKNYVALHARMELEMMNHRCGKSMQRNLTRLFNHVELLIENELEDEDIGGIFVAVSRAGMEISKGQWYDNVKFYADDNLLTLNRVVGDVQGKGGEGLGGGKTAVFECGKRLMDKYYSENPNSMEYGSLLESVVNFYVATEARAFIGVRGSSYSTDIWTTRYHQGKGDTNYEYTLDGIIPMENGGLPPKHTDCSKLNKK